MECLKPFLPRSHGKLRVNDRRVLRHAISINRNGLRWCDARQEYGPAKTLDNRWKRWSDNRVFARMKDGLAAEAAVPKMVMVVAFRRHRLLSLDDCLYAVQPSIPYLTRSALHRCLTR